MKYSEMEKFLNDNGIFVIQPVIAYEVDAQLECEIEDEEFEDICKSIFKTYIDNIVFNPELDIWYLVDEELVRRGYKEY